MPETFKLIRDTKPRKFIEVLNFVELKMIEKLLVLSWRNHPLISNFMFNKKNISKEEHLKFINSLVHKKDQKYYLVKKKSL